MTTAPPAPFSVHLRSRTTSDHRSAERNEFTAALLRGQVPLEGYVDLLAQHRHAYEALEALRPRHLDDPVVGPFLDARLLRLGALDGDLVDLAGPAWAEHHPASAATTAYVARIAATASWPGGHLAHHHTRYLGDLSGGQHIGAVVARTYGLEPGRGGRFATFDQIDDPVAYRSAYRERLDALAWDSAEQERVVDEVHQAYACNTAVFEELGRHLR
jgi:heme oxygenase